jgi:geranylgeranyl diphosphate synthase type II
MLGGDINDVLALACGIEMIHTYSLIHDDLPSMDNDDYRRGRLTNHKVYGEAIALLAGDSLLNYAFEIMLDDATSCKEAMFYKVKAMSYIAKLSGTCGMIGGQIVDLQSENKTISDDVLRYMHRLKTGAMIKAPVMGAATICKASNNELDCLEMYAEKIGLAFQVKDDILDVEGSLEVMGKNAGSDEINKKSTFVTIYGLEESKRMLSEIIKEAHQCVEIFGERAWFIRELAEYIVRRER